MKTEVQISIRTTKEFKEKLEKIAAKEKRPTANLIKIILEEYVEKMEKKQTGG